MHNRGQPHSAMPMCAATNAALATTTLATMPPTLPVAQPQGEAVNPILCAPASMPWPIVVVIAGATATTAENHGVTQATAAVGMVLVQAEAARPIHCEPALGI
jgi:hypothetical protein